MNANQKTEQPFNIDSYYTVTEALQAAQIAFCCYLEDGPLEGELVCQRSLYPPRTMTFETPEHVHTYVRAFRDLEGDLTTYERGRGAMHSQRLLFRHATTERIRPSPRDVSNRESEPA